jgi:hypothetical protein
MTDDSYSPALRQIDNSLHLHRYSRSPEAVKSGGRGSAGSCSFEGTLDMLLPLARLRPRPAVPVRTEDYSRWFSGHEVKCLLCCSESCCSDNALHHSHEKPSTLLRLDPILACR